MPRELVLNAPTCMNCGGLTRPPAGSHPVQNCNCHETAFDDDEDDRPPRTSRDRAIANTLRQMTPPTLNDLLQGEARRGRNDTNVTVPHQAFSTDAQYGDAPPAGKPSQAPEEDETGTEVVDLTQESMARLGFAPIGNSIGTNAARDIVDGYVINTASLPLSLPMPAGSVAFPYPARGPSYLGAAGAPPETPARVTTNREGGVDLDPAQTWPPMLNWAEVVQEQRAEDAQRAKARRPVNNEDDLPGTIITDGMWPPVIRW